MPTACTVTGTFQDATSAALQGNAFVRFRLRNFSGFVPRVLGTAIIVEPQIDAVPNASGQISVPVWGNDQIDPGGTSNPPSTFYTVEFWNGGRITSQANYSITGSTFDLGTAAQTSAPSPPKNSAAPAVLLQTNGTKNGSQTKLNLVSGSNIALADDGNGDVTISAASSMGIGGQILYAKASFSSAEVLAGAQKTLVPAPGPNKILMPLFFIVKYIYGGVPYSHVQGGYTLQSVVSPFGGGIVWSSHGAEIWNGDITVINTEYLGTFSLFSSGRLTDTGTLATNTISRT